MTPQTARSVYKGKALISVFLKICFLLLGLQAVLTLVSDRCDWKNPGLDSTYAPNRGYILTGKASGSPESDVSHSGSIPAPYQGKPWACTDRPLFSSSFPEPGYTRKVTELQGALPAQLGCWGEIRIPR